MRVILLVLGIIALLLLAVWYWQDVVLPAWTLEPHG